MLWRSTPSREATQYICKHNKTLLRCFLPWCLKITREYTLTVFFFSYLYSRQKTKCQNRNTELANRLWQCCISEVWVTLEKRWACGRKHKPHFESGMQNYATDAKWISLTLWLGQIISGLLLWDPDLEDKKRDEGAWRRWRWGYLCRNE